MKLLRFSFICIGAFALVACASSPPSKWQRDIASAYDCQEASARFETIMQLQSSYQACNYGGGRGAACNEFCRGADNAGLGSYNPSPVEQPCAVGTDCDGDGNICTGRSGDVQMDADVRTAGNSSPSQLWGAGNSNDSCVNALFTSTGAAELVRQCNNRAYCSRTKNCTVEFADRRAGANITRVVPEFVTLRIDVHKRRCGNGADPTTCLNECNAQLRGQRFQDAIASCRGKYGINACNGRVYEWTETLPNGQPPAVWNPNTRDSNEMNPQYQDAFKRVNAHFSNGEFHCSLRMSVEPVGVSTLCNAQVVTVNHHDRRSGNGHGDRDDRNNRDNDGNRRR